MELHGHSLYVIIIIVIFFNLKIYDVFLRNINFFTSEKKVIAPLLNQSFWSVSKHRTQTCKEMKRRKKKPKIISKWKGREVREKAIKVNFFSKKVCVLREIMKVLLNRYPCKTKPQAAFTSVIIRKKFGSEFEMSWKN